MSQQSSTRKILIGDQWLEAPGRPFSPVTDPTTNQEIAKVPVCGAAEVGAAVTAAAKAFETWRDVPAPKRAAILFQFQNILIKHQDELARLVTQEHGKVLSDAMGSVRRGLDMVEFACGVPALMQGQTSEDVATGIDCASWRQPLGVCGIICPFNFPIMVPMWFAPIAIACGNTVVIKPSDKTPLTMLRLAELWQEAGLPAGVLNVVPGGQEAVEALIDHPQVKAISFVGSTPVGRAIYENSAKRGKRVQALAGAKNHLVVMPDANLGETVAALIGAGFGSAGERCMAISVCVTVGDVAEPLLERLVAETRKLHVGPGLDAKSEMGPLVTRQHMQKVVGLIDAGEREGAKLLVDGRGLKVAGFPDGNWVGPTIFDHVRTDMTVYREEIFGPVLCVVRVKTLAEALALINSNPYGNGTAIFTSDGLAARTFRKQVQVGMVGINVPIPVPMAFFPFTGWKNSFFGTLHAYGRDGVQFFTEQKIVTSRWFAENSAAKKKMGMWTAGDKE
jgi:malonate-semialdehyde dehydrogenase (acetylating)/methylmalonate-semialdehyde dehydrogenase